MRLTKTYPSGAVTLDGSQFGINQEVLDIEIRNSKPIKAAVERLKELEDRDEPQKAAFRQVKYKKPAWSVPRKKFAPFCPSCNERLIHHGTRYCESCGQRIDWSKA